MARIQVPMLFVAGGKDIRCADYATFGPVYATPGKGAPVAPGELARAAASGLPVYALGGITLDRFGEAAATGAAGIAAIRLFQPVVRY